MSDTRKCQECGQLVWETNIVKSEIPDPKTGKFLFWHTGCYLNRDGVTEAQMSDTKILSAEGAQELIDKIKAQAKRIAELEAEVHEWTESDNAPPILGSILAESQIDCLTQERDAALVRADRAEALVRQIKGALPTGRAIWLADTLNNSTLYASSGSVTDLSLRKYAALLEAEPQKEGKP